MELVEGGSLAQHLAQTLPTPRGAAELVATFLSVTVHTSQKRNHPPRFETAKHPHDCSAGPPHGGHVRTVPKIADFILTRFVNAGNRADFQGAARHPQLHGSEQALGKPRTSAQPWTSTRRCHSVRMPDRPPAVRCDEWCGNRTGAGYLELTPLTRQRENMRSGDHLPQVFCYKTPRTPLRQRAGFSRRSSPLPRRANRCWHVLSASSSAL